MDSLSSLISGRQTLAGRDEEYLAADGLRREKRRAEDIEDLEEESEEEPWAGAEEAGEADETSLAGRLRKAKAERRNKLEEKLLTGALNKAVPGSGLAVKAAKLAGFDPIKILKRGIIIAWAGSWVFIILAAVLAVGFTYYVTASIWDAILHPLDTLKSYL